MTFFQIILSDGQVIPKEAIADINAPSGDPYKVCNEGVAGYGLQPDDYSNRYGFILSKTIGELIIRKAEVTHTHEGMHTHTNKLILDGITSEDISQWEQGYNASHIHLNDAVLNNISANDVANWNGKAEEVHSHAEFAHIDDISSITFDIMQTAHGFNKFDVITHNGSNWIKASPSDANKNLIIDVIDTANFKVCKFGRVAVQNTLQPNILYYVSENGTLTTIDHGTTAYVFCESNSYIHILAEASIDAYPRNVQDTSLTVQQITTGFAPLQPVRHNGVQWVKADNSTEDNRATHIVNEIVDNDTMLLCQAGVIDVPTHNLPIGTWYYTASTAGDYTTTIPEGVFKQQLFMPISSSKILVDLYVIGSNLPTASSTENITYEVTQENHSFQVLESVYLNNSGVWVKAIATDLSTTGTHIISEVVDTDNFKICLIGKITKTAHGLVIGKHYYTSSTEVGGLTDTPPVISNPMFIVLDSNTVEKRDWQPSTNGGGGTPTITKDSKVIPAKSSTSVNGEVIKIMRSPETEGLFLLDSGITDTLGNVNPVLHGATLVDDENDNSKKVIDTSTGYVDLGTTTDLDSDWTYSLWVYYNATNTTQVILSKSTISNFNDISLILQNGQLQLYMSFTGGNWGINGAPLLTDALVNNTWNHIAVHSKRVSNTLTRFTGFVNGVVGLQVDTPNLANLNSNDPLLLSSARLDFTVEKSSKIAFYNRVLSNNQIFFLGQSVNNTLLLKETKVSLDSSKEVVLIENNQEGVNLYNSTDREIAVTITTL